MPPVLSKGGAITSHQKKLLRDGYERTQSIIFQQQQQKKKGLGQTIYLLYDKRLEEMKWHSHR